MSTTSPLEQIVVNGRIYGLSDLSEFGFVAPIELPDGEKQSNGVLILDAERIDVEFRVRSVVDGDSSCTFANFPIAASEKVRKHLKRRGRQGGGLDDRSYDELANGLTSNAPAEVATEVEDPDRKGYVKSFALLALLMTMIGLAVLATVFLRSRSSLGVSNAALTGNCLPVNAKVEGEIVEVLVTEGDHVKKGDVLLRLSNPEITNENQKLAAQRKTADAKVRALEKQKKLFVSKLAFASRKLELNREVALSELDAAKNARKSAKAAFERLKPFVRNGAVTQLELDEVENQLLSEESNCIAKENLVKQIDFSLEAAKENVLIIGDRVDDELGKIEAELEIAIAEAQELLQVYSLALNRQKELDVIAPRDGLVYVNYRQRGEFIKVADELIGLSYQGETWAAGQVTSAQASRVLPGQPVRIRVPSMKRNLDGIVMSVGHRAMYSKGHYNADFRGATATDVPVKVYIEDLPENIPSGIRLEMAINTGFGIEWLDDSLGYELKNIGSGKKSRKLMEAGEVSDPVTLASLPESPQE